MAKQIRVDGDEFMLSNCITCGVKYTVPLDKWQREVSHGGFHTCPNGHSQGWGKDDCTVAKLTRERDGLKQQMAAKDDEIAAQAREMTRLQKRAKAGTCPCCKRTFSNMSRHMKTKHPEFAPNKVVNIADVKRVA